MLEKNYKVHCSVNNIVSVTVNILVQYINANTRKSNEYVLQLGDEIVIFWLQPLAPDFSMRSKIEEILTTNEFEKKRSRSMDIDDFLG